MKPKGRASNHDERVDMFQCLLRAWGYKNNKHLRLGQLITNATDGKELFYIEDWDLIEAVEKHSGYDPNKEDTGP